MRRHGCAYDNQQCAVIGRYDYQQSRGTKARTACSVLSDRLLGEDHFLLADEDRVA